MSQPHASPTTDDAASRTAATGMLFGFAAYGWWAFLFPLHLKALNAVTPAGVVEAKLPWSLEVLAHRLVWSLVLCLLLCWWLGRLGALRDVLRDRRTVLQLALTAALVTINWLVFIVAMARGELYRAGIGYFVTPVVQIALGTLLLGERLRRGQWWAIGLTAAGMAALVAVGVALGGGFPWIETSLALAFGFYGLARKRARAGPIVGLTVETGVLTPIALAWLLIAPDVFAAPSGFVEGGAGTVALLAATGVSTTVPLLCFAAAAARLPLSTIGFLQFLAPSGQLVLSLVVFGERPADPRLWFGYALIGAGVLTLVAEGLRARLRRGAG